jgi:5'-3' exonuclease
MLAVDTPSLLYRAFFALPKSIKGADGKPVNALLGTANMLLQAVADYGPRAVICCFGAEAGAYRVKAFPAYHADRPPMPPELEHQWELAPDFLAACGWSSLDAGDLEADDLLGSLATLESKAGGATLIFSGDRDMFQCASKQVTVLYPSRGGPQLIGPAEVRRRSGVDPLQIPDLIALRGDPSDGIPGAKGIGEKGAALLLSQYGSLEAVLAAADDEASKMTARTRASLLADPALLRSFKAMATLQPITLKRPKDAALKASAGAAAARELGMNRLAERLEKAANVKA